MTIEARLRDDDSIPTLHLVETISIGSEHRPTGVRLDSTRLRWLHHGMTSRRSDTRVMILAALAVVVAGLVIAAAILLVTGRAKTPAIKGSIPFGLASSLRQKAKDGGPFAFAGDSGDTGFWIALEHGKLVALKIRKPGTRDCNVVWRGSINTFVDCNGKPIRMDQLARYPTRIPKTGGDKGVLLVNLSANEPAPASS
jgi:hypothetical protein